MEVFRIPVLSDNYTFLLFDPGDRTAAVVDPAVAAPVVTLLQHLDARLVACLITHHHYDHIGGIQDLTNAFPEAQVYGGTLDHQRIPRLDVLLDHGDRVSFAGETAQVFFVPGHTKAHIAYYFPHSGHLFCGDTLFAGGCGYLSEGTPTQMLASMETLRSLPDDTQVWCAHEYTLTNLRFALTVDPENSDLHHRFAQAQQARQAQQPTVPSTIGLEKRTNPFMRWDQPALIAAAGILDSSRVFARIRGMKDRFT